MPGPGAPDPPSRVRPGGGGAVDRLAARCGVRAIVTCTLSIERAAAGDDEHRLRVAGAPAKAAPDLRASSPVGPSPTAKAARVDRTAGRRSRTQVRSDSRRRASSRSLPRSAERCWRAAKAIAGCRYVRQRRSWVRARRRSAGRRPQPPRRRSSASRQALAVRSRPRFDRGAVVMRQVPVPHDEAHCASRR